MWRRLLLVLTLLASLALVPLARAAQPCCESGGCDAMPACVSVCALCASPVALPVMEPSTPEAAPARLGPAVLPLSFDNWIDEIWSPPD
ncbi:hypothetical protein [Roseateles asaccharophilus]|uniref:Secreted protein n=1 Tax=Roseateles asaccharophilus TaxID=582607 RepID=A0ABU2AF64_9BURK|nr:hypothetical protein [Roseateles asaccharophilus]MDR7335248.1 hypothetical protein [Roseateles asaccharophilus]